ncbi:ABC transporter permease [Spirosoma arcticum]
MLRNYLKIALRNLWKHKLFSVINVFGLASGLVVCFLAIAHVKGTLDYDNFHPNRDRIYRIITDVTSLDNDRMGYATSPLSLADALKRNYDFVEETVRIVRLPEEMTGNYKRLNVQVFAVDSGFFSVFDFRLKKGRPATEPRTAVVTHKTAERYFGTANPIGKVLQYANHGPVTITGVLADLPLNTHLKFDVLVSLATYLPTSQQDPYWGWQQYDNGYTYVLLTSTATAENLKNSLPSIVKRATQGLQLPNEKSYSLRVQSLSQISPAREMLRSSMNVQHYGELLAELFVGLITLLLAGFNYVNLTLARSISRAREVGVRKVVGALRWQLMGQFMVESVVLSLLALGLAYGMAEFIRPMPTLQQWFMGGLSWDVRLWLILIAFTLVTGVLAGLAPARILSGFEPAQVFRSYTGLRVLRGLSFRKSLIVAQFSISLIALIVLLTLTRQFQYLATADYGFRRERLLTIPIGNQPPQRLMNELSQLAGVEHVSATSELLSEFGDSRFVSRERNGRDSARTTAFAVDSNFVRTMGLTLVAGRNLPATSQAASRGQVSRFILINEEAVRKFQLGNPSEAVGRSVWLNDSTEVQIAGVLKNFRFATLSRPIGPLLLLHQPHRFRYISVAVAQGGEQTVVAKTERIWKRLLPYEPFMGEWYDDFLHRKYDRSEDTHLLILLIGMALLIACLGLLGIVTYNTQMRVKEVGIRKVMGATVTQIVTLLSWGFLKLLLIAGLIAYPLGYLAGRALLHNFAYRVSIGLETIGLCFGILLMIGSLTIGIRTYRAALANPADSLRSE